MPEADRVFSAKCVTCAVGGREVSADAVDLPGSHNVDQRDAARYHQFRAKDDLPLKRRTKTNQELPCLVVTVAMVVINT